MNSKERVLTAINHQAPDRVPVTSRFTPEITKQLAKIIGLKDYANSLDLEVALGHDLLCTKEIGFSGAYSIEGNKKLEDGRYIDEYGMIKKVTPYKGGSYVEIVGHPLDNLDNFSSYKLPDPDTQPILQKEYKGFEKNVAKYGKTHAIVGGVTCTILEASEMLRGMEKVLVDFIENPDFLNQLMDMLMDYHFQIGKKLIEIGVDVIYIGDDAGMQTGMLIPPDLWRKFLKPRYEHLFSEWKKINRDILFAFHTDGYVEPIVEDFIEIGLDILNPVQPGTMDDRMLKKKYGRRLSFWGGINVQKTMPFGSPQDVVAEVKDRIDIFGKDGGFIISPSHNVQPNVNSIPNTFIYYWACNKFGQYK